MIHEVSNAYFVSLRVTSWIKHDMACAAAT